MEFDWIIWVEGRAPVAAFTSSGERQLRIQYISRHCPAEIGYAGV